MPSLDNEIEAWFFNMYHNIKSLSGFEYQITITDFKHYFDIYPSAFPLCLVISVIKKIERKVYLYNDEQKELKRKADEKNKKQFKK